MKRKKIDLSDISKLKNHQAIRRGPKNPRGYLRSLKEFRINQGKTIEEMANLLETSESIIIRLEEEKMWKWDLYLLREYIEALGGVLDLRVTYSLRHHQFRITE